MAPLITQNTLEDCAPLIKLTFEPAPIVNAPFIFITKKAFGFPPPSRVRFPAIDPAPPRA